MIYTTKRFSQMNDIPDEIKKIWKEIEEKEKSLLKKYNITPDDWFCDIWVKLNQTPNKKDNLKWGLPEDSINISGVGIQGALDIYYSPGRNEYWTDGDCAKDTRPTKVTPQELKKQIIFALQEDLKELKDNGCDRSIIKFQEENINMISKQKNFNEITGYDIIDDFTDPVLTDPNSTYWDKVRRRAYLNAHAGTRKALLGCIGL